MSLALASIASDVEVAALVDELVPAFRDDAAAAREVLTQTVALLTGDPRPAPWGSYLALEQEERVGICAFKAAPDGQGTVELAYMTFPGFEGPGHATAMAGALAELAFAAGAALVIAHTLPQENASSRALRRNGFGFAGETIDPEDGLVWRWEKRG